MNLPICSICGGSNCEHLASHIVGYSSQDGMTWSGTARPAEPVRVPARDLYVRDPAEWARYLYTQDPVVSQAVDILQALGSGSIVTRADVDALLLRFGVKRYIIDTDAVHVGLGTVRIKIFQFRVDLKKIREEFDKRKAAGVCYIITKMSILDYLRPLNVYRYIRLKYLRYLRKRPKKVVTKFHFMVEQK